MELVGGDACLGGACALLVAVVGILDGAVAPAVGACTSERRVHVRVALLFSRNTRNQLKQVFDALRELMTPPDPPKRPIGFVTQGEKKNTG